MTRAFASRLLFAALLACMLNGPAHAAVSCVSTATAFQNALTAAQTNGDAQNTIRVVAGTYNLTSGLAYSSAATSGLSIIGGYSAGCAANVAGVTELNGQDTVRPLFVYANNATIRIEGFDFTQGLSTNNRGGGLFVRSDNGVIQIRYNRFLGNRADDYAGALNVAAGGAVRISGNLFVANSAAVDGAIEITSNGGEVYFLNNTVVLNSSDSAQSPGGLRIGGSAHYSLSNNILWNNNDNGAPDLLAASAYLSYNNDIGLAAGNASDAGSTGNISVNPMFENCGFLCISFELDANSPLVDAGTNAPPGLLDARDLANRARPLGASVDIGAFEYAPLFDNGFEN